MPSWKVEPDVGEQETLTPGTLSVAVTVKRTTALLMPASVALSRSVGHITVGGMLSVTVIVNVFCTRWPEASTAVAVTVLTPMGKAEPDGGSEMTVTPGKSSVAVTS